MPRLRLKESRAAAFELLFQICRRIRAGRSRKFGKKLRILLKIVVFFLWIGQIQVKSV